MTRRLLALVLLLLAAIATPAGAACVVGDTRCLPTLNVDPNGNYVAPSGSSLPATITTGQVKIATTGTPVQLPSNVMSNGYVITSKQTNLGVNGYDCVGGTSGLTTTADGTGNGSCKPVGSSWAFGATNSSAAWVDGAAGDVFFLDGN